MPDAFLDADEIRAASFVRHVEIHDTLGSTNDRAAELACDPHLELPALVVARLQTAGRGRGQNTWWSAEGALTVSILLDPATLGISTANWPQLSLATAVAVCDALAAHVGWAPPTGNDNDNNVVGNAHPTRAAKSPLGIKWPNDVMLDGGKVCGILIESPGGSAPAKDRLIIGIGINVNNSWHAAPREAGPNGTALCDATGRPHDMQGILISLLKAFDARIHQLAVHAPQLSAAWQQLCWLTEQRVEVQTNSRWIDGVCVGIDTDGALVVENVFGTHRVCSGSVRAI